MTMRLIRASPKPSQADRQTVEDAIQAATPEQLLRLLADIRAVKPWWDQDPMGRA
jgi:hypothetical protein